MTFAVDTDLIIDNKDIDDLTFAVPKIIISTNEPKTCCRCGKKVPRPRSESWNIGLCSTCYHRGKYMEKDMIDNSNPLETMSVLARNAPFTLYLDQYTISEMENMK